VRRPQLVLGVVLVVILGSGGVIYVLGCSGTAAVLGMLLAAALSWVPTLLAWEQLTDIRREQGDHDG
jgi:hypothetical protein